MFGIDKDFSLLFDAKKSEYNVNNLGKEMDSNLLFKNKKPSSIDSTFGRDIDFKTVLS